jgi:hypothetical protein
MSAAEMMIDHEWQQALPEVERALYDLRVGMGQATLLKLDVEEE